MGTLARWLLDAASPGERPRPAPVLGQEGTQDGQRLLPLRGAKVRDGKGQRFPRRPVLSPLFLLPLAVELPARWGHGRETSSTGPFLLRVTPPWRWGHTRSPAAVRRDAGDRDLAVTFSSLTGGLGAISTELFRVQMISPANTSWAAESLT